MMNGVESTESFRHYYQNDIYGSNGMSLAPNMDKEIHSIYSLYFEQDLRFVKERT